MKHTIPAILGTCLLFQAVANAASFDCRRAQHPIEKAVCTNDDISKLDDELAAAWKRYQTACADPTKMRLHTQQSWMADLRNQARYYFDDANESPSDAEKRYASSVRDNYQERINALDRQIEECQWLAAPKPDSVSTPVSPLDCDHPADVVEQGMCQRDSIRALAEKLHAAYASAVATCADPQVDWHHPLADLIAEAKRTAKANEERNGVRYTPSNVDFGNIDVTLKHADRPWNELKISCENTPLAERRSEMHIPNASKQLLFTIKKLGYTPGEDAAHLEVVDVKSKRTLVAFDLPSIVMTMENGTLLTNSARLYDDQGTINVGDFNFDGLDDFAVQIGYDGSYGGPSYAVFLRTANAFIHNQRMSDLTLEGLGFFGVDPKTRTLITFSKSGCCDHWATTYKVVNNQPEPVQMSREVLGADGMGRIEDSVFTAGRWKKVKVQTYQPAPE